MGEYLLRSILLQTRGRIEPLELVPGQPENHAVHARPRGRNERSTPSDTQFVAVHIGTTWIHRLDLALTESG
jgi:hypothetical protein